MTFIWMKCNFHVYETDEKWDRNPLHLYTYTYDLNLKNQVSGGTGMMRHMKFGRERLQKSDVVN